MNKGTPTFIWDSRVSRKRFQPIPAKFLHLQLSNSLMIYAISVTEGDLRRTEAETKKALYRYNYTVINFQSPIWEHNGDSLQRT